MPLLNTRSLLIGLLCTTLAACGGGGSGSVNNVNNGATPASTTSTAPTVSASVTSPAILTIGAAVHLSAQATGSNLSYAWNFGDGSPVDTTSGANPVHTYLNNGNYPVSVVVTDSQTQLSASASLSLTVMAATLSVAIAGASPSPALTGQAIQLSGRANGQGTLSYAWNFGDGSPVSTSPNPVHTYSKAGTYTVGLEVTDSSLEVGVSTITLPVSTSTTATPVTASFTFTPQPWYYGTLDAGSFTATGTGQGVLSYYWNFGDQATGTGAGQLHTYTGSGPYVVQLTVVDGTGASATSTQTISFPPPASVSPSLTGFTVSPGRPMAGNAAVFTATASGGGSPSYTWNFGDGTAASTTTTGSTSHVYAAPGQYIATVTVSNGSGSPVSGHITLLVTPAVSTNILAGIVFLNSSVDGTGASANFSIPTGSASDSSGNLYLFDSGTQTIRMVTPAGVVSTVAGSPHVSGGCTPVDGPAASAVFCNLTALTVDNGGNIYVGDSRLLREVRTDGTVTTIAGPGTYSSITYPDGTGTAAAFATLAGLASDSNGNIYVADGATIRKVTPAGEVSTLAGSTLSYGCSSEIDGTGKNATFCGAKAIVLAPNGNLYVADTLGTVRKVTTGGVVSTLAGSPYSAPSNGSFGCLVVDGTGIAATLCSPGALAADSSNNLYVTDTTHNVVREITSGGTVTTIAGLASPSGYYVDGSVTTARFNNMTGLSWESSGLYVTDTGNNVVRQIASGMVSTLAGTPGTTQTLTGYQDGTGAQARFNHMAGMAADSNGNVFVADIQNHLIRKITSGGTVTTLAGSPPTSQYGSCTTVDGTGSAASFCNLGALALDGAGNVYVTDGSAIRKITSAGAVTTLAGSATTSDCWQSAIVDGTGSAARFCYPIGLATDSSDNVYVADSGDHAIRKITPAGVVSTLAGKTTGTPYSNSGCTGVDGQGSGATLCYPTGITISSAGNLFVADQGSFTIRRITPTGTVTTLAGTNGISGYADSTGAFAQFRSPSGIAFDSNGFLYIVDGGNLRKLALATATVTTINGVTIPGDNGFGYYNPYSGSYVIFLALLPGNQLAFGGSAGSAVFTTSGL